MTVRAKDSVGAPLLMEASSESIALRWVLAYLGCSRHMARKPAIVLDIDGTVLINRSDGAVCVARFTELARACSRHGISLFCITARPYSKTNYRRSIRQLFDCGIYPVAKLFMRPDDADYLVYKRDSREAIFDAGYRVLVTIGDQFADVTDGDVGNLRDDRFYVGYFGSHGTFGVKLPSEFAETRSADRRGLAQRKSLQGAAGAQGGDGKEGGALCRRPRGGALSWRSGPLLDSGVTEAMAMMTL